MFFRAVAAVTVVSLGWGAIYWYAAEFDPRFWYGFILLFWVTAGPALAAVAAAAPEFRGREITVSGLCAAVAPMLFWYIHFGHGTGDSGPIWLLLVPIIAGLILLGAVTAWCVATVFEAAREIRHAP